MTGGQITVQDETSGGVRKILGGSVTYDGFLFFDRIEDSNGVRKFKEQITLNRNELAEFYSQLKVLMEDDTEKNYMVLYESCCSEHGDTEIDYFETLEEAEKNAWAGYKIFKLVKEIE